MAVDDSSVLFDDISSEMFGTTEEIWDGLSEEDKDNILAGKSVPGVTEEEARAIRRWLNWSPDDEKIVGTPYYVKFKEGLAVIRDAFGDFFSDPFPDEEIVGSGQSGDAVTARSAFLAGLEVIKDFAVGQVDVSDDSYQARNRERFLDGLNQIQSLAVRQFDVPQDSYQARNRERFADGVSQASDFVVSQFDVPEDSYQARNRERFADGVSKIKNFFARAFSPEANLESDFGDNNIERFLDGLDKLGFGTDLTDIDSFVTALMEDVNAERKALEEKRKDLEEQAFVGSEYGAKADAPHRDYWISLTNFVDILNQQGVTTVDGQPLTVEDLVISNKNIRVNKDFQHGNYEIKNIRTLSGMTLLDELSDADFSMHPGFGLYTSAAKSNEALQEIFENPKAYAGQQVFGPDLQNEIAVTDRQLSLLEAAKINLESARGYDEKGNRVATSDVKKVGASLSALASLDGIGNLNSVYSSPLETLRQKIAPQLPSISVSKNPELSAAMRSAPAAAESTPSNGTQFDAGEMLVDGARQSSADTQRSQFMAAMGDESSLGTNDPGSGPVGPSSQVNPFDTYRSDFDLTRSDVDDGSDDNGLTGSITQPGDLPNDIQAEVVDAMTSMFGIRAAFWNLSSHQLKIGVDQNGYAVPVNSKNAVRVQHLLEYITERKITDDARIFAAVEATNWYNSTNASMREFDTLYGGLETFLTLNTGRQLDQIQDLYDKVETGFRHLGVQVSQERIIEIAATLDYFGYELDDNEIYTAVMEEAKRVEDQFNAETSAFTEFASARDQIQRVAAQYYLNLPASVIANYAEQMFTRDLTLEKLNIIFKEQASARYADDVRVQSALNAGLTLEEYFAPYAGELENELQRPVNLFEEFPEVLEYMGSDGTARSMTYAEMRQFAREQPEWAYTSKAQDLATEMVTEMGKLFGRYSE